MSCDLSIATSGDISIQSKLGCRRALFGRGHSWRHSTYLRSEAAAVEAAHHHDGGMRGIEVAVEPARPAEGGAGAGTREQDQIVVEADDCHPAASQPLDIKQAMADR